MKSILMFFALIIAFAPSFANNDEDDKNVLLLKTLVQNLNGGHFSPQVIDDGFSEKIYNEYLGRIDVNKRFLTADDIKKLEKYKYKIDDEIEASEYEFFDFASVLLNKRIENARAFYKDILDEPFDFNVNEKFESDADKIEYASNEKELEERWRLTLKYQTLANVYSMKRAQDKRLEKANESEKTKVEKAPTNEVEMAPNNQFPTDEFPTDEMEEVEEEVEEVEEEAENMTFEEMEEKARKKVKKSYDDMYERLEKLNKSDRLSVFINTITGLYDPHTNYYPPRDKENFDIQMSGKLEGIGARLQDKDGYITVSEVVPGGPAAKQEQLEAEDKITKVAQGKDVAVDIVGMRIDDAVQMIRGKKGTEVRLTVQKIDGTVKIIPIIRDVVELEESFAKSVIIENTELGNRVGLIHLPRFYIDFNDPNGRMSAADVEIEVKKLMAENVDGIIIDLRNNGGGSLEEVVRMVGMFIEDGPIVQVKAKEGKATIYKDRVPGVIYEGPLAIMVNNFSASSSEILAAAIQDYKRGVVIGSESTFGKGTVQRFTNLDRSVPVEMAALKPIGSLKLTTHKFYRVNGGATQLKGVNPDIVLPDAFSFIDIGEKENDYAMKWSEIEPANYQPLAGNLLKLSDAKVKSKLRVAQSKEFALIKEDAMRRKESMDQTSFALNYDAYEKFRIEREEVAKKYKNIVKPFDHIEVSTLDADMKKFKSDEDKKAKLEKWYKQLKKDIYLEETTKIMSEI